jgi:tRNA 2-selenouridine synthase
MRSGAMAWALTLAGFKVITLAGGYKAFRSWVRRVLAVPKPMIVVGGMTGTAKTDILQALDQLGEPVLDLEALANHRGSSYGALGMPPQPSTEQFENLIADCWRSFSPQRPIWVEAESRRIGTCRIPDEIVHQMEQAPTLEITRPLEERLTLLVQLYGQADPDALIEATERIRRRLGGQRTQAAVQLIRQGNLKAAVAISLDYYDRTYRYDLERRQQTIPAVEVSGLSALESAQKLLAQVQRWGWH